MKTELLKCEHCGDHLLPISRDEFAPVGMAPATNEKTRKADQAPAMRDNLVLPPAIPTDTRTLNGMRYSPHMAAGWNLCRAVMQGEPIPTWPPTTADDQKGGAV